MAVVQVTERRYFATSSDTKPAAAVGALLYETDTLRTFIYVGGSWTEYFGTEDF